MLRIEGRFQVVSVWYPCAESYRRVLLTPEILKRQTFRMLLLQGLQLRRASLVSG